MRGLARDVLVMALATGVVRLFGLAREVAIANRFGATAVYDAFLIAFFVPHFLRQLLAEGALSTAFVPVYAELKASRDDADRFASNLLSVLIVVFPLVVLAGVFLAPYYVPFLASGFPAEKLVLTVALARVVFPFIALVGFAAVFMGILNFHHRFFAASFAPVWFNVGTIVGALVLSRYVFPERPIYGLAIGVLLGGGGQLLTQLPSLRSVGFRFRFTLFPLHRGIHEMIRRLTPALVALAVTQVNLLVDNKIASHLADGSIASLQYAMRLFQLPLGVFAVSIATALLPRFSTAHARGENERFSRYLTDGVATTALVLLPATAGLLLIGPDVIRLLFEHGSFRGIDTVRTAHVLSCYLVGLLPYGLVYVQTRACYAKGRTIVPLVASACAVGTNVALDLLLVASLQEAGLALATAVAGIVNASVLSAFLWTRASLRGALAGRAGWITLGTVFLAGVVLGIQRLVEGTPVAVRVFVPMMGGILFYLGFVRATRLRRLINVGEDPSESPSNEQT